MENDSQWMTRALEAANRGVKSGQTPFGACLVRDGKMIVCTHNHVWHDTDITAHAEVQCIRQACQELHTIDLTGCVIYSTTEPCPMCFSAIHWARIGRIVYGASIADAKSFGFSELEIANDQMKALGQSSVQIVAGCMKDQVIELFRKWQSQPDHRAY